MAGSIHREPHASGSMGGYSTNSYEEAPAVSQRGVLLEGLGPGVSTSRGTKSHCSKERRPGGNSGSYSKSNLSQLDERKQVVELCVYVLCKAMQIVSHITR